VSSLSGGIGSDEALSVAYQKPRTHESRRVGRSWIVPEQIDAMLRLKGIGSTVVAMTPSSDLKDLAVRAGRDRTRSCDASCDVIDFDPGQTRTYRRPTLVCNTHLLSSPQNVPPHKLGETLVAPKQIHAHTSRFEIINSFNQTLVTLHESRHVRIFLDILLAPQTSPQPRNDQSAASGSGSSVAYRA
jgi:hypothetical protein